MAKYAVDFSGWIHVEADSQDIAFGKALTILSTKALTYEFVCDNDGDFEIVDVTEVDNG